MANEIVNQDETSVAGSKYKDINTIMRDPVARAELNSLIDEAVNHKVKIAELNQKIKLLREAAIDEIGINPKLFNAYVAASFNNDYLKRKAQLDEQVTMLEYLTGQIGFQE